MRRLILPIALLLLAAFAPSEAHAQACPPGAFDQRDMAGTYESAAHAMYVEIRPCGISVVWWANESGAHVAQYLGTNRVREGGIAATGFTEVGRRPLYLDGSSRIGFLPAEPGWIHVWTQSSETGAILVYRLAKTG